MVSIEKEKCISCLACVAACPFEAIKFENLFVYVAHPDRCNSCDKMQCKILCPTGAII